jgi:hypothetical protein
VESLADRVLVLERGRVVLACQPHERAERLDLRLTLKVRVPEGDRDRALAVLRASGLAPMPNGRAILLDVPPNQKARPIGLLERAGVPVVDFSLDESATRGTRPGEDAR